MCYNYVTTVVLIAIDCPMICVCCGICGGVLLDLHSGTIHKPSSASRPINGENNKLTS